MTVSFSVGKSFVGLETCTPDAIMIHDRQQNIHVLQYFFPRCTLKKFNEEKGFSRALTTDGTHNE